MLSDVFASRRLERGSWRAFRVSRSRSEAVATKSETPEDGRRTFRADIAETDAVLDGVAEAHALLNSLRGSAQAVEQARHLADLLQAQLAPLAAADHGRQTGGASRRLGLAERSSNAEVVPR